MPVVPDLDMWRDLWEILILCRNALELVRINEKGQEEEISVSRSQFRVKVKSLSCVRLFATPWTVSLPGSSGGGKSTGVGCHFLLQGIFPTQGSNPCLPHCTQILYQLSHQGSPRLLEWVVYPFSGGTCQPRNWSGVFCLAGGFFTSWATHCSK